jgi:hypothetical protein
MIFKFSIALVLLLMLGGKVFGQDDALIVSEKCGIFYSPNDTMINEMKDKSEEDFFIIADDNMYYLSEARTYIESAGLNTINTDQRIIHFKKSDGQTIVMDLDVLDYYWGLILFDPDKDPVDADIVEIEPFFKDYFNK